MNINISSILAIKKVKCGGMKKKFHIVAVKPAVSKAIIRLENKLIKITYIRNISETAQ